jgi:hypothetical protein
MATCPNCGHEVQTGRGATPLVQEPVVEEAAYASSDTEESVLGEEE